MGNPAWGHGYGQGHAAGIKQGGLLGSFFGAGAVCLAVGGKFLYDKRKADRMDSADSSGEDSPGELGEDQK